MNNKLIVRFLCAIGIHKMPKWGEVERGTVTAFDRQELKDICIQRRSCTACNARKMRIAI